MRALTVHQPWASLIVAGIKDVENRTWPVPKTLWTERPRPLWPNSDLVDYNSPFPLRIAIHAGASIDAAAWRSQAVRDAMPRRSSLCGYRHWYSEPGTVRSRSDVCTRCGYAPPPTGVLLGTVLVTGCHHARDCAVTTAEYDGTNALDVFFACTDWAEPWQTHDSDGDLYHWTLANPVALDEPVPMRGRQGLWNAPNDALSAMSPKASR